MSTQNEEKRPGVPILVGPTAVGKTALSLKLSERLNVEIVSADSRQVYKYMDIGTAKPSREELAAVPHHFIDIKRPDEYYSAGQFAAEARACIDEIWARGNMPLVVGGSGLYIRALVDGLFEPKVADAAVKARLKQAAQEHGIAALYRRLREIDPAAARRLHATDSQRILRALEVFEITGRPFSVFLQSRPQPATFRPVFLGLFMPREALYARIEVRVDRMFAEGLIEEARRLLEMGFSPELNALQTVGYREVFLHLRGDLSYEQTVTLVKQKTRNYAKRQLTWFRKDSRVRWLELSARPDSQSPLARSADEIVELLTRETKFA